MKIDHISCGKSALAGTPRYVMNIELNGFKYTGYFDDMPGLLLAVTDAAKFFMVKLGRLSNAQAKASREIQDVQH